jgi:hypothetical protein
VSSTGNPETHRDPALNGQWVLDQGGDAVKFFCAAARRRPAPEPGEPDLVEDVLRVTREVVDDAHSAGVPAVIENLIYPLPGEELTAQQREDAIIEAARALNDIDGVDLLKLEYPARLKVPGVWLPVLTRPWAVLSAGVPFEQFTDVLQVAFDEGGASGFIAGRSVWKESIGLAGAERDRFLNRRGSSPAAPSRRGRLDSRHSLDLDRLALTRIKINERDVDMTEERAVEAIVVCGVPGKRKDNLCPRSGQTAALGAARPGHAHQTRSSCTRRGEFLVRCTQPWAERTGEYQRHPLHLPVRYRPGEPGARHQRDLGRALYV